MPKKSTSPSKGPVSALQSHRSIQRVPTRSISPQLHEKFQRLLLTFLLRQAQGKVTFDLHEVFLNPASEIMRLEDRFGDEAFDHEARRMVKTYPTRKEHLFNLLSRLVESEERDPEAVYAVLSEAKRQAQQAAILGQAIDNTRKTIAPYPRLKRKSEQIRQALKELAKDPDLLWVDADAARDFERRADALIDSLHIDTILSAPGPRRRQQGAGRPKQPWNDGARRELAALGVSREDANILLSCIGLQPDTLAAT